MQTQGSKNRQTAPALTLLLGAALVAVGVFLDWWSFSSPASEDFVPKGIDISQIVGVLAFTVVVAILGIVMLVRGGGDGGGRGWAIAALIVTLFPFIIVVYSTAAASDAFAAFAAEDVGEEFGVTEEVAEAGIKQGLEQGNVEVGAEIGTYLATAGTLLMVIGSIMGIASGGKARSGYTGAAPAGGYGPNYPPQQAPPQQYPPPGQQPYPPPGQQQYPPQGQAPPGQYPPSGPGST